MDMNFTDELCKKLRVKVKPVKQYVHENDQVQLQEQLHMQIYNLSNNVKTFAITRDEFDWVDHIIDGLYL